MDGGLERIPRRQRHLVPLQGITRDRDEIVLPWTKEQIESAPTYDEEDDRGLFDGEPHFGVSQEKEDEAFRHYGLERPATLVPAMRDCGSGSTPSAPRRSFAR